MSGAIRLPGGETVPALGQGTWMMAEAPAGRAEEIAALRLGLDLGLSVIDTAEMYGEGASEELVGEAIAGRRDEVFLVSKVYPHNASRAGVVAACERSLTRLATDRIDLYLLHWRGAYPLAETVAGFAALQKAGKIRHWGVSNFDVGAMRDLFEAPGGKACAANQILYNPQRRGVEFDLLPWLARHGVAAMAYSPIEQGRLPTRGALAEVAARHGASPAQIALAFALRRPGLIAIPKAGRSAHVRENAAARDIELTAQDMETLDRAFPPPTHKRPLEML